MNKTTFQIMSNMDANLFSELFKYKYKVHHIVKKEDNSEKTNFETTHYQNKKHNIFDTFRCENIKNWLSDVHNSRNTY